MMKFKSRGDIVKMIEHILIIGLWPYLVVSFVEKNAEMTDGIIAPIMMSELVLLFI